MSDKFLTLSEGEKINDVDVEEGGRVQIDGRFANYPFTHATKEAIPRLCAHMGDLASEVTPHFLLERGHLALRKLEVGQRGFAKLAELLKGTQYENTATTRFLSRGATEALLENLRPRGWEFP